MSNFIIPLVAGVHIVSHFAICILDYTQVVGLLDFVTRHDGSPSDPNQLLPLELIYAGLTAMSFGTVGFAFCLALKQNSGVTYKGAATLSVFFHTLWVVHMIWRWDAWTAMMHPNAEMMTPSFFLLSHAVWTLLAGLVVLLSSDDGKKISKKEKSKSG